MLESGREGSGGSRSWLWVLDHHCYLSGAWGETRLDSMEDTSRVGFEVYKTPGLCHMEFPNHPHKTLLLIEDAKTTVTADVVGSWHLPGLEVQ